MWGSLPRNEMCVKITEHDFYRTLSVYECFLNTKSNHVNACLTDTFAIQCSMGRSRFLSRPWSTDFTVGLCTSCSTNRWDWKRKERLFVDLMSNLALFSNESHNFFKVFFPQIMSNNLCFPTKRRILISSRTCKISSRTCKISSRTLNSFYWIGSC